MENRHESYTKMADTQTIQVGGKNLASPMIRIVATVIDFVVATIITTIVTLPFGVAGGIAAYQSVKVDDPQSFAALNAAQAGSSVIAGLLGLIVWALIFIVFPLYVWKGQTLGKKLLNIRIAKADGSEAEQMDILKRYSIPGGFTLVTMIPVISCIACVRPILAIVNTVMLFTDAKRQTVYDKVGETIVVEA
jgi:uncharacterized RDD family membrane protein YckC